MSRPEPRSGEGLDESGYGSTLICTVAQECRYHKLPQVLPHANLNFVNKGAFRQTKDLSDAFVFFLNLRWLERPAQRSLRESQNGVRFPWKLRRIPIAWPRDRHVEEH